MWSKWEPEQDGVAEEREREQPFRLLSGCKINEEAHVEVVCADILSPGRSLIGFFLFFFLLFLAGSFSQWIILY